MPPKGLVGWGRAAGAGAAAADIHSPVSGMVAEVSRALEEKLESINHSAERQGWICKLKNFRADDLEPLMTEDEYAAFTTH